MGLSTPTEQYLRLIDHTDDLVVDLLLNVVNVPLKMANETHFKADTILGP